MMTVHSQTLITQAVSLNLWPTPRTIATQQRGVLRAPRLRTAPTASALPHAVYLVADIAEKAAPGSVDAPIGTVIVAAVVVSAAALAVFTLGLKPGTDAALDMQKRDSKTGRWRK